MPAAAPPDATERWARAQLALAVLAVDPQGLGGLWLRARSGPARDRFLDLLKDFPLAQRKVHPDISDEQLFGGLDLSATLQTGHRVTTSGILSEPCAVVLTMAERCPAGLAARLGRCVDGGEHTIFALDEGADDDETLHTGLTERLGLFVSLDDIPTAALHAPSHGPHEIATAKTNLNSVEIDTNQGEFLTVLAAQLGISSLRAPLLAIRAAKAVAALFGHGRVTADDMQLAAELVFAQRATAFPDASYEEQPPAQPEAETSQSDDAGDDDTGEFPQIPQEILLEAVRAALPADVLASLAAGRAPRVTAGAGAGARRKGNRRGRPLPSRPGRLDSSVRIDLVATLRTAAPWQPMRLDAAPDGHMIHIRPDDIRIKRFEERSDRLLVFAVDASGSAAMARLAEAKGAVEILLAEAYARRDHVALIAFRGAGADVLLPPTRSLVQTKRRLAALPGGGGTPLAAGLQAAMSLAHSARGRGMSPTLAVLTDGRANIALDGSANRQAAGEDALTVSRALAAQGIPSLVIDMSTRPQPGLNSLAQTLNGQYLALPRADAHRLSVAVSAAFEG